MESSETSKVPQSVLLTPHMDTRHFRWATVFATSDWEQLFAAGEKLTPYKVSWHDKILPLLTPEVMLLAFIRMGDIPLGKRLEESGLLVGKLEEAANRHIENPD